MTAKSFLAFVTCIAFAVGVVREESYNSEDILENLETFISLNEQSPAQVDKESWLWQPYEFGTGAVDREELRITDIQIWQDFNLQQSIINWQYVEHKHESYVAGTENSTLFLYHFDHENNLMTLHASLSVDESIKSFKIVSFSANDEESIDIGDSIIVVLSIENANSIQYLKWFYLQNQKFYEFWVWELVKTVKRFEHFIVDDEHKLVILYEKDVYFNQNYSLVEVYYIKTNGQFSKHLCCQFLINEISDIRVCPLREGSKTFALMNKDYVTLHEYKDVLSNCVLESVKNITVSNVNSVICFESSNINHLAVSGFEANFFKFRSNEFVFEKETEILLNGIGDVHYITYLPIDTYRNDVVLLIQSKNLKVYALCWQNEKFQFIRLPNNKFNGFDLSKIIIIPNYGFLGGNSLVKLNVELIQLPNPKNSGIETLFRTKSILENILKTQESIISKIESEMQLNYLDDTKSENLSDLAQIDVDNLSINGLSNVIISMESSNFTLEKLQENYEESRTLIHNLESEIGQIEDEVERMTAISSTDISFLEEIDVVGNFEIAGTAIVKSLFTDYLNKVDADVLMNNCLITDGKIMGNKSFPTIKFSEGSLKIKNLNGVPIRNFQFGEDNLSYTDVDVTKIRKLEVRDNLNVSKVNGVNWNTLMNQLVFRNKNSVIPGRITFSGVMNTTFIKTNYLNDYEYPFEYVLKSGPESGEVTGIKTIESLTISDLQDVKTINGIDADEFIILTADQKLEQKITFENLVIEESLQIDGNITGLPEQNVNPDLTLLNSNTVQSNTIFKNLIVTGKVYVENSINGVEWSEIDDLILKTDEKAIVTGTKIFPYNVQIHGNLEIKTSIINKHHVTSFITLDSQQILPSLTKISGNVQFTHVTYKELEALEDKLRMNLDDMGVPKCSLKPFVFLEAPIVDELSFSFINNITGSDFSTKLDIVLNDVNFLNLKCKKLIVQDLKPVILNGRNVEELENERITRNTYQELSGPIKIKNFNAEYFHAEFINNRSYEQLKNTVEKLNSFYKELIDSGKSIDSLSTNKFITTPKINDINLHDFLDLNKIAESFLRSNASIENLTVKGLINNINFTEKFFDCVLKNEKFVSIKGPKIINNLKAHNLKVDYLNGHAVEDIVTEARNQTLLGSLIVKGSVYVNKNFVIRGKINELDYKNIHVNIEKENDTIYTLTGDFFIDNGTSITNLVVAGRILEKNIIEFMDNLIYLNDTEVMISSSKIFNGNVTFKDYITPSKRLNNIELESFYNNAISINNPTLVNSAVIFENDVLLEEDLVVVDSLKVGTISGMDIESMMDNAVYFNRPTSIMETVTLSNVVFKSDIEVKFWNDTDLELLLTLNTDQVIQDTLTCVNVGAENLTVKGPINGKNLIKIYENTFMISADQHITGKISFLNNVHIHGDLAVRYMNDIDITKIITLETSDSMEGNFVFDNPLLIDNDVVVLQYLNNINISQWQSNTISTSTPTKTIISGNWTIHYNSDFKRNIRSSGFINGVSVNSLSVTAQTQNEEITRFISDERKNINTICKNLQERKKQTDYLLHKFKSFEYFRVLQFDKKIESAHHFEFNNTDYILVNFETCHVDIYANTNEGFLLFANASDFGNIKQYLHFNYKDNLYFVTIGKVQCGRNAGNLWMIQNEQIKHIHDLGNVTNIEKLNDHTFVVIVDHQIQEWSVKNIHKNLLHPTNMRSTVSNKVKFFTHGTDISLASCDIIYRLQNGTSELYELENPFKSIDILGFEAGVYKKEYILLHDDQMSSDNIFIYDQDLSQPKELQSIRAHKPNSFIIINFDGLYESFLLFSENKREIQIYEYKGIQHFKFHSSIKMKADKLYSFQLLARPYLAKRQCIAIVHGFKLTILEAKMYGERLDTNKQLICSTT